MRTTGYTYYLMWPLTIHKCIFNVYLGKWKKQLLGLLCYIRPWVIQHTCPNPKFTLIVSLAHKALKLYFLVTSALLSARCLQYTLAQLLAPFLSGQQGPISLDSSCRPQGGGVLGEVCEWGWRDVGSSPKASLWMPVMLALLQQSRLSSYSPSAPRWLV